MNRFRCRMVPVFALALAAACSDDSFTDIQGDLDRLVAAPTQLFIEIGETETVQVSGVDGQGNPLTFNYEVTDPGTGIDVRRDSTFLPVYVDDSTLQVPSVGERYRFVVTGLAYGTTAFTVSAGGQDVTIPVQVVPQNGITATFSNATPALGETVTITAPAGTRFSPTSTVTAPGEAQPAVISIAADGSSMDVVLPPNLTDAQLILNDVVTDAAPGVVFAPTTTATITTPAVPNFPGTFSNLTPGVNEAVTLTLTGATFDPATTLLLGAGAPTITDLTANTVTFIPAPGTTALLVAQGVILDALPQIALSLPAPDTDTIKVSADIPTIGGTDDPGTAPSLVTPGLDRSSVLFDKPDYEATADHFYKLVVTQEGLYTITLNWDIGSDVDMFLCPEAGVGTFDCDFTAATGAHPETAEFALTPGTYYIVADDFGADAIGTTLQINVDHAAPAPPAVKQALATKAAAAVRKVRK
jgi:hypothetical protein